MTLQIQFPSDISVPFNRHSGNQQILNENREHFSGQAKVCLDLLMNGETVTSKKMLVYDIIDTRARIYTLKSKGIQITEKKILKGNGAKEWSMSPDQVKYNLELIKTLE